MVNNIRGEVFHRSKGDNLVPRPPHALGKNGGGRNLFPMDEVGDEANTDS